MVGKKYIKMIKKTKTKTKTKINLNLTKHQLAINPLKYKQAIEDYMYEEDKKFKEHTKKLKKYRRFHIWYMFIFGSLIVGWETYQIGNNILNYEGWNSILLISANLLMLTLWSYLIHNTFKIKQKMKEEKTEEILNELTKE